MDSEQSQSHEQSIVAFLEDKMLHTKPIKRRTRAMNNMVRLMLTMVCQKSVIVDR